MRLSDLRADLTKYEATEFVGGVYPRRHLTIIASEPGLGKTWLVLRHAIDVACALPLFGTNSDDYEAPEAGTPPKSVIFCGEAGASVMVERLHLMGMTTPPDGLIMYTLTDFARNNVNICLDMEEGMRVFANVVAGEKPDVVFIDTLIAFRGEDECDQKSTALLLGGLRRVAEDNNCAIVLTHHIRKRKVRDQNNPITQDDIIGTSAFTRLCSIAYTMSRVQFTKSIMWQCVKSWWEKPAPFVWNLTKSRGIISLTRKENADDDTPFCNKAEHYITAEMHKGSSITIGQLAENVGCSESTARNAIKAAIESGTLIHHWTQDNIKYYQRQ